MSIGQKLDERGPLKRLKARINKLEDMARAMRIAPGVGYRVNRTASGQILSLTQSVSAAVAGNPILVLKLTTGLGDNDKFLQASEIDDDGNTIDGTSKRVMIPEELKLASSNEGALYETGGTISVTSPASTDDWGPNRTIELSFTTGTTARTTTADQLVWPPYNSSDLILVTALPDTFPIKFNDPDDGIDKRYEWADLNVSGRVWAHKWLETEMCVDVSGTPTTKRVFLPRTDTYDPP